LLESRLARAGWPRLASEIAANNNNNEQSEAADEHLSQPASRLALSSAQTN
jgi:hypothetical protein